jgi:hypothetical protein
VVYPGYVRSVYDGQQHYIGARTLMRLYGVNPAECVVWDRERPETFLGRDVSGLIPLYPQRYWRNYKLPEEKPENPVSKEESV